MFETAPTYPEQGVRDVWERRAQPQTACELCFDTESWNNLMLPCAGLFSRNAQIIIKLTSPGRNQSSSSIQCGRCQQLGVTTIDRNNSFAHLSICAGSSSREQPTVTYWVIRCRNRWNQTALTGTEFWFYSLDLTLHQLPMVSSWLTRSVRLETCAFPSL